MADLKIEFLIEDGFVWGLVETGPEPAWERICKIEDLNPLLKDFVIDSVELHELESK